ncbi:MAG: IS1595 family transposase [Candidatus Zixiibacteriota bacterium]
MNIVEVYDRFPTNQDCLNYLEKVRWKGKPTCPYCDSQNVTPLSKENRHHCNTCNTSFSVTVRTIFHKTKLPLQKWFLAISLVLNAKKGISARQLARDIKVNKDTAWSMGMRIRRAMIEQRELMQGIVEMDETYIGGKPRKGGGGGHNKRGRGTKKAPVIGIAERNGKIKARPAKNVKDRTLRSLVRENVDLKNTVLITDEFTGYSRMSTIIDHQVVNHHIWYADGYRHTNNIESFWALLKRGIVGQYHKVSIRHLSKYIDEFCYRHNNRGKDDLFDITISRALGGTHE